MHAELLIHIYDPAKSDERDGFCGQALIPVTFETWERLSNGIAALPRNAIELGAQAEEVINLPSIRGGYGPNTTVRVMQIIIRR
ncbi:MAG: hypothetical protein Q7S96_01340 [bacterium]|nr:hypothetical protein [bacterium]